MLLCFECTHIRRTCNGVRVQYRFCTERRHRQHASCDIWQLLNCCRWSLGIWQEGRTTCLSLCMSAVHSRRTSLRCKRPRPIEMPVAMQYPCVTEPACCNEFRHHHQANVVQVRSSESFAQLTLHQLSRHLDPWAGHK